MGKIKTGLKKFILHFLALLLFKKRANSSFLKGNDSVRSHHFFKMSKKSKLFFLKEENRDLLYFVKKASDSHKKQRANFQPLSCTVRGVVAASPFSPGLRRLRGVQPGHDAGQQLYIPAPTVF